MKYAICYLEGRIQEGIEDIIPLKEVLQAKKEGEYQHTDYYCSVFDSEEEAWEAWYEYRDSYGQEYELLWNKRYKYVSSLGEIDL